LENSEKGIETEPAVESPPVEEKPKTTVPTEEFPKPKELPKPLKSPKITKPEPISVSPKPKEEPKTLPTPPPKQSPRPSPLKIEKPKPRLSDSGTDGLFEAAMTQKLRSPVRLKKQMSSESKPEKTDRPPTPTPPSPSPSPSGGASQTVSKFKPVKQSSPSKETPAPPTPESQDPNLPKFKPLPFSGNITKKSKTFKFRTPQGAKHEMNLVDSIFSNDSGSNNPPEVRYRYYRLFFNTFQYISFYLLKVS
jgi:hypothetical protein